MNSGPQLFLRVGTLAVFFGCLVFLFRGVGGAVFEKRDLSFPVPKSPLLISAPRYISNPQGPEIAFNVTNVFTKEIRAYSIKQVVGKEGSSQ